MKPRMTADIVTEALTMARFRRKPAPGVLHKSGRGSQQTLRYGAEIEDQVRAKQKRWDEGVGH